jgi:hypothetical protein
MASLIRSAVGSAVDVPKKREAGLCAVPAGLASWTLSTRHSRAGLQVVPSLRACFVVVPKIGLLPNDRERWGMTPGCPRLRKFSVLCNFTEHVIPHGISKEDQDEDDISKTQRHKAPTESK